MSKKKNLPLMIIVLLFSLLIIVGSVFSAFYLTGVFPSFNAQVEKVLASLSLHEPIDATQSDELLLPITIDGIRAAELTPYFSVQVQNEKMPKPILLDRGNTFLEYEFNFSLFDDRYSLKCEGIFERLNSDYDGEVHPASIWEYRGDFPIISSPSIFADSIVFIDAEPKLVQLDLQTGSVITTQPSPAYPDKKAGIINLNSYVFSGRDGNTYAFEFLDATQIEQKKSLSSREYIEISSLLAYSEKTLATFQNMFSAWMGIPVTFNLQAPLPLSDTQRPKLIPLKIAEPLVFAYTPQEQGTYTVGLCDENGRWITAQGFAAIFSGQGELQSGSIAYVADQPQTTLHLAASDFYYITVGLFPAKDNSESSTVATESYYIMVKKTS